MNWNQVSGPIATAFLVACLLCAGCSETASVSENDTKAQSDPAATQSPPQTQEDTNVTADPVPAPATKGKAKGKMGMGMMKFPAPKDMKFKDNVKTNADAPKSVAELVFTGKDGSKIKLSDYNGKKHVILVFTEGFNGMLCPFCQTQTSRLVANYEKFEQRDCEIIVVYPGPTEHVDEFVEAALKTEKKQVDKLPFPIVLDQEFQATNYFDIHSKHAHPSTYLIDKNGGVQFAYVGSDMTADRLSVKALLKKLDELK